MSTTISKLEVELTLDSKHFEARVRGSKDALAAFSGAIGKADTRVKRHEKNVRNLGTSFRHTVVTLGLLRDAIRTAWRVTGGLVQGIVDVTAEFERLNVLLTGMSKGVTAMEKMTDAADQFNKVIDLAKNAPFAVKELTNSWVKFKSVGIDPATGSLNALVDAVSAFGGTGDILHRATIAVQQMGGKGVISMEELRQQMGEAVPQAMVLLARGMNMSVGNMVDAISKGSVIAKPALQKLFAEFNLTFGGASQKLMETYIGSLARLSTVWQLTLKEMGEASGLFEAVKEEVKQLIVELDDPAVRRFGIDIASGMVKAFRALVLAARESVKWLSKHADTVWKVIAAWGAFRAMGIIKMLFATNIALKTLTTTVVTLASLGFAKMTGNAVKAGLAMKGLGSTATFVSKAFKGMKLPGLVGIILSVIAVMWGWWRATKAVNDEHRSGIQDIKDYGEAASKESVDLANKEIEALKKKEAWHVRRVQVRIDEVAKAEKVGTANAKAVAEMRLRLAKSSLNEIRRVIQEQEKLLTDAVEGAARRASANARREALALFRKGLEEKTNAARDEDAKNDILFEKGILDERGRLRERLKTWKDFQKAQTAFAIAQQQVQVDEIMLAQETLAGKLGPAEEKIWKDRLAIAISTLREIGLVAISENLRLAASVSAIASPTVLMSAAEKLMAGYASSLNTIIGNSKAKLASLNAELFDGSSKLASFIAKVNSGKIFGNVSEWSDEMKQAMREIIPLLFQIDKISEEVKNKNSLESAMNAATKSLAKAKEEALIFSDAVGNKLNEAPDASLRKIRRHFAGVIADLERMNQNTEVMIALRDELLDVTASISGDKKILDIRTQINELNVAAIQNLEKRFEEELRLHDLQVQAFLLENKQAENIVELTELYETLRDAKIKAFEDSTPMKRMLKDWEDTKGKLQASYASWMDGFVNTIVDGVAEGKFAFKDFVKSALKDLLKILMRALMVRAVMAAMGNVAPVDAPSEGFDDLWRFAKGGIMSPNGPVKQYARGGIATKPQISVHGEGSMNEAYVPLPDGRSIPVTMAGGGSGGTPDVTVNVINESGVPVDAEQDGGLQFDGEGYVLDVVLKAAHRPGNFRDGLKTAVKS